MNVNHVKKLREPQRHRGTWISSGSPVIAEIAAECGFEWLLFDLEHGFGSEESLLGQLMAIKGTSAAAVVRVGAPHSDLILRVLDRGADGIMIPHVSTAEEAKRCVQAVHFPPHGKRGFSSSVRACVYGLRPVETTVPPLVITQIETVEGVGNAAAIAAVDGVDALFVGPADLKYALGVRRAGGGLDYETCLKQVADAAASCGKACGILLRNEDEAERVQQLGYTLIALHSDLGILRQRFSEICGQA